MKKEDAVILVKKLCDSAFKAGQYSNNSNSLILKEETEKVILLSHKIIQHLT